MNTITDSHTHRPDATQAVISVDPAQFNPAPGLLYSVGIHPWQSSEEAFLRLPLLEQCAQHPQVVAVGETGLDSLQGAPPEVQMRLMQAHIAIAAATGKPLVVHCVRTSQQVLQLWRHTPENSRSPWMIHGFRGNERVLRPLVEAGMLVSYGPRFNPASLLATPPHQLLIETDDAPITIPEVATKVAATLGTKVETLTAQVQANAARFFFGQKNSINRRDEKI